MRPKIQLFFRATCRFDADANVHVAGVPELGVFSQGTTVDEAFAAVKDALELFLSHCYARNILDDTLRQHGFDLAPPADGHPSSMPPDDERSRAPGHP